MDKERVLITVKTYPTSGHETEVIVFCQRCTLAVARWAAERLDPVSLEELGDYLVTLMECRRG